MISEKSVCWFIVVQGMTKRRKRRIKKKMRVKRKKKGQGKGYKVHLTSKVAEKK